MDTEYGGVKEGIVGPVEAKLASFPRIEGWVFGKWGECSPDVHNLIREMAKSRISYQQELERKEGRRSKEMSDSASLSLLTGQIRRGLSLVAVRSQARLLLDPVEVVGQGAVEATRRRRWVAQKAWTMEKEQKAYMLGLRQETPVLRRGEIFVQ